MRLKKKHSSTAPLVMPAPASAEAKLTPQELTEFRLRRSAYEVARAHFLMVEEAYALWAQNVTKSKGLNGRFNIDAETGVITRADG